MNDIATDPSVNGSAALVQTLADLERRVQALETKVAALPDAQQMEERVAEQVKAGLPPPPPPIDPSQAPGFRDIQFPMPSMQTVVDTAKTTWMLLEMLAELKLLFWTLFDRRYHAAWLARVITVVLLLLILTSSLWLPLAFDNIVGHIWEKIINLMIGFAIFFVLHYEMRRYREWRNQR
jgi:hypothetical protein